MTTGVKDVDLKILSELDDMSLLKFCTTSKYAKKLCEDEIFWLNRTLSKYGRLEKNPKRTWKNLYLKLTYYLDKYTKTRALVELVKSVNKNLDLIKIIISFIEDKEEKRKAISRITGDKNLIKFFEEKM